MFAGRRPNVQAAMLEFCDDDDDEEDDCGGGGGVVDDDELKLCVCVCVHWVLLLMTGEPPLIAVNTKKFSSNVGRLDFASIHYVNLRTALVHLCVFAARLHL